MNQIISTDVLAHGRVQRQLTGWQASLSLTFAQQQGRTVLTKREHEGPLVIQKALYPEGDAVCHGVIVHPPGGVAGGDHLNLQVSVADHGHVLLTTPGAGKWYKSAGRHASQKLQFSLADKACMEWMPQENIVFDGADVGFIGDVMLGEQAVFAGWEIICFGRQASGEQWQQGHLKQRFSIRRCGRPIWLEQANLSPASRQMSSLAVMGAQAVNGSFVIAAGSVPTEVLEACRAVHMPTQAIYGVTALPHVFAARYLGYSAQEARHYFESLWHILRPWYGGRAVTRPRIWAT